MSAIAKQGAFIGAYVQSSFLLMLLLFLLPGQRTILPLATALTVPSRRSSLSGIRPLASSSSKDHESETLENFKVTWKTALSSEDETGGAANDKDTALSFDVYSGETLRTAALRRNVASPHNGRANLINCRGLGTCGTCAVEIVSGQENIHPSERNQAEQLRFSFPPHNFHNNTRLRLACQIQVRGDIEVIKRTGFWGQREDLAEASAPQHYFGDLEYLLDNKSPELQQIKKESSDGKES